MNKLIEKIELIMMLLDNPKEAIEIIIIEKPLFFSLIIFILGNFSFVIADINAFNLGSENLVFGLFAVTLFELLFLVIASSILHFTAELFKSKGSILSLFMLFNFSLSPALLLIPVSIISKYTGVFSYIFCFIIIIYWISYLGTVSMNKLYNFSTGKTILVTFTPVIAIILILIIFFALSVSKILSLFL